MGMSAQGGEPVVRVLVVEDNPGDLELLRLQITEDRERPVSIREAGSVSAALVALMNGTFDIILLDLGLPDSVGLPTLESVLRMAPATPVIVLTGREDLTLARRCLAMGAQDYVPKSRAHWFSAWAIHNAVHRAGFRDERDRERDNLQRMVEATEDAVLVLGAGDGLVRFANKAARTLLGAEVGGRPACAVPAPSAGPLEVDLSGRTGRPVTVDVRTGELSWYGEPALVVTVRDVTQQKEARTTIANLNRLLRGIRSIGQLIVQERDPATLCLRACELLVETGRCTSAWIRLSNDRGDGDSLFVGSGDARFRDGIRGFADPVDFPDCWSEPHETADAVVVRDPEGDCGDCRLKPEDRDHVAVIAALGDGPSRRGVLGVAVPGRGPVSEEEIAIIREVAGDIAFALRAIESEHQRRDAEERLRVAFEQAADGQALASMDGRLVRVNESLCQMLRKGSDDLLGANLLDIAHPDDRSALADAFSALRQGTDTARLELRCARGEDAHIWVHAGIAALRRSSDAGPTLMVTMVDTTERKRTEHALRRTTADLQQAQEVAHIGSVSVDLVKRTVDLSDELIRILGLSPPIGENDLATLLEACIHPADKGLVEAAQRRQVDGGSPGSIDCRIVRPSGEVRWVRADQGALLSDADGVPRTLTGVVQDITERKRAEDAVRKERDFARSLLDTAPVVILLLSPAGRVVTVNPHFEQLTGHPVSEAVGKIWFDTFLPAPSRTQARDRFAQILGGAPLRVRVDGLLTRNGRELMIEWYEKAMVDESGATVGLLAIGRDVTESLQIAQDLDRTLQFNETLMRSIPFPLHVVDDRGRVLFRNERMVALTGSRTPGETCWETCRDDGEACPGCPAEPGLASGETHVMEVDSLFGGKHVEVTHTGMTFGDRPALLAIFRDVTEQLHLQAQVAQADRLASMGMLAAGVAHEINNPLAYVLYNIESVCDDLSQLGGDGPGSAGFVGQASELPPHLAVAETGLSCSALLEDVDARLRSALSGAKRIKEIARGLSTFSRVERTDVEPVDVHGAINHAIAMAYNEIKYRAKLVKDIGDLPVVMATDGKLAQVFLNLLINAAHAIGDGNVKEHEIRVRAWAEGELVLVEVSDTGPGVAADSAERIFEPFFTTKGVGAGSGLGLAICKNIVRGFGGDIGLMSPPGQGARFRVSLPAAAAPRSRLPEEAPREAIARSRGRLLLVDDDDAVRRALHRLLRRDHDLVTAASGEEAQKILEADRAFDVLFVDIMMPQMSGVDLHAWLSILDGSRSSMSDLALQFIEIGRDESCILVVYSGCQESPKTTRSSP